ncbi:MAG: hypothetical protein IPP27_13520 [Bacteroidetes bacterium]|nr:hypothetical protein [Bacteroidota bacterium]
MKRSFSFKLIKSATGTILTNEVIADAGEKCQWNNERNTIEYEVQVLE